MWSCTFYGILSMFLLHFKFCEEKKDLKESAGFRSLKMKIPDLKQHKVSTKMNRKKVKMGVELKIDVGSREIRFSSL